MLWADLKDGIVFYTGLERDAVHVHAALLLYIAAMGIFRQSRRSRVPWLVVLAVELANEAYDFRHNLDMGSDMAFSLGLKDLWNTMLWPTVLLVVGRYTNWFHKRHDPPAEPQAAPET